MPANTIITKKQSLLRSTSLVSLLTLISRIVGFARDIVLANFLGAQAAADAFYVAFRIPNFMRRLFAEGAFAQAFVPVLTEYQLKYSEPEVKTFIARVAGQLSFILSLVTIVGVLAAPIIILIFAPGFGEHTIRTILATELLRLTFPYLMLISLTAMAGAVLNSYGYFGVPAITPILLNLTLIATALFLSPYFTHGVLSLGWGVLIAGILQLLLQLTFLRKQNLLIKPQLIWHDEGVKQVLKLMIPALFGVSVAQINLLVDSILASFLQIGSVSWLYYTERLNDFPLGVFGVAIATVILPHLSRHRNTAAFSATLDWGLRLIFLIAIPSAIGLTIFSLPLIASCFAYGKFSVFDLLQTQKSLITLSLGIPAFMAVKILASSFYAHQDLRTPVLIATLMMILNSVLCLLLIYPLAHAGLTLASSCASYLNCILLFAILKKRNIYQPTPGWCKFIIQLIIANSILACYLYLIKGNIKFWLSLHATSRLISLLSYVISAIFIYFIVLLICRLDFKQFRGKFTTNNTTKSKV